MVLQGRDWIRAWPRGSHQKRSDKQCDRLGELFQAELWVRWKFLRRVLTRTWSSHIVQENQGYLRGEGVVIPQCAFRVESFRRTGERKYQRAIAPIIGIAWIVYSRGPRYEQYCSLAWLWEVCRPWEPSWRSAPRLRIFVHIHRIAIFPATLFARANFLVLEWSIAPEGGASRHKESHTEILEWRANVVVKLLEGTVRKACDV